MKIKGKLLKNKITIFSVEVVLQMMKMKMNKINKKKIKRLVVIAKNPNVLNYIVNVLLKTNFVIKFADA